MCCMKTLTIRTDAEVEQALESLTRDGQSRSEATRAAILAAERAHRRALLRAEAEQLRNDPDDVSSSGSLRSCSASARRSARRCARSAARIAALVASDRDCPSRVRDSRACSTSASVRIVSVFIQQIVIHHPILCPHVLSYLIPADACPGTQCKLLCNGVQLQGNLEVGATNDRRGKRRKHSHRPHDESTLTLAQCAPLLRLDDDVAVTTQELPAVTRIRWAVQLGDVLRLSLIPI